MKDIAELQKEEEQREEQKRQEAERERLEEQLQKVELEKQPQDVQIEQQLTLQKDTNNSSNKNSKIIICVVVVIAIVGLIMFNNNGKDAEDAEENSDYIVLQDKQEDFTIELPKDWSYEVIESEEDQTYSVNCINQELESSISVRATPKVDDVTADDLVDLIGVYYLPFGFNPISRENVMINNADGVKYEMIVGDKEIGEFYQTGFVTIDDEYNFSISIQSAVGVMDQMKPTFEHVINSFELK